MGRHTLTLATDDFHRRTLADIEDSRHGRHTAEQPAVRVPERTPVIPRQDGAQAGPAVPLGLALTAERTSPSWGRPPEWDAVLTEVHPGQVRAEPDTWGGRGRALHAS